MEQYRQPRRRRRSRKRGKRGAAFISVIIMLVVVGFAVSMFFKVAYVEVTGTNVCQPLNIITSSGLQIGDLLLFTNKSVVIRRIMAENPYVEAAAVKRKLPSTIEINITECEPVAFIKSAGYSWLIDGSGKLLEKREDSPDLPELSNFQLLAPIEGMEMSVGAADTEKIAPLLSTLKILKEHGLYEDIKTVSYDDISLGISFSYMNRFEVMLGIPTAIETKLLKYLPQVIDGLEPNASGTIDLTDVENKIARFIPN